MWVRRAIAVAAAGLLLSAAACSGRPRTVVASHGYASAISAWLAAAASQGKPSGVEHARVRALYEERGFAPVWLDAEGRATAAAQEALAVLRGAADDGLVPDDYGAADLTAWDAANAHRFQATDEAARFDVGVTWGLTRYLHDLHEGRINPQTVGFRLAQPADHHDFAGIAVTAAARGRVEETVAEFRPRFAQYRLLRDALARYRRIATAPSLSESLQATDVVRPGDAYGSLDLLRRKLVALGDLPGDAATPAPSGRYEGPIVDGVKRFQRRHGLEPDGVLGKATAAALRVPMAWRVTQIELALERLRWLPHLSGERIVGLNIPMFRLWVWDGIPESGMPLFGMDAVVGRALRTRTPVFAATMREVIFRPYWNVPTSILRNEVLPRLESDPDYLRRENMEIVRGQGDDAVRVADSPDSRAALRRGTLRIRQRPGPRNALGLIKFVFPNTDDVYMHGTPAQALFARSRRDFSHGCVRVADPIRLAEWALEGNPEWTRERIVAATAGTETVRVQLGRPVEVFLFYTTAAVMPENGAIGFADDIYGHDERLSRALAVRGGE